jgi:hypothetical protein
MKCERKQYVSTGTRGQDSLTLFFQNCKNKIASYPSAIIFSLIIREYDIISPHRILGCVVGCAGIDSSSLSTSGAVHRSYLCISRFSQFLQQWIRQDVCECLVFAKFATMRKRQHPADHNDQQLVTDCSLWLIESQTKDQVPKRIKDKKWSTKYYTENSRVCYTTSTKTREWAQGCCI